jgi:hypothetical protein
VPPAATLLDTDAPPLLFAQQPSFREGLRELLGQDDVAAATWDPSDQRAQRDSVFEKLCVAK